MVLHFELDNVDSNKLEIKDGTIKNKQDILSPHKKGLALCDHHVIGRGPKDPSAGQVILVASS